MRITAIPFLAGAWAPYLFGWWGGIEFPIAATVIVGILVLTRNMETI